MDWGTVVICLLIALLPIICSVISWINDDKNGQSKKKKIIKSIVATAVISIILFFATIDKLDRFLICLFVGFSVSALITSIVLILINLINKKRWSIDGEYKPIIWIGGSVWVVITIIITIWLYMI